MLSLSATTACAAGFALAAIILALLMLCRSFLAKSQLLGTALNNMSQGLVMFDKAGRLIIYNEPYVTMYRLSHDVVRRGATLQDIMRDRYRTGSIALDTDQYAKELLAAMAEGKTVSRVVETAGRAIAVINRPIAGSQYWVGTHEDITERRDAEKQRTAMREQEQRRAVVDAAIASFREGLEAVLKTVNQSTASMKATATKLSALSGDTSQQTTSAVHVSNEAATNVTAAAAAAEELLSSIGEISRQLEQTTGLVSTAVADAQSTNEQIAGLAQAAQEIGNVVMLIRSIAGQTNLLALNATIEAARAGESGKGFAVVATEVKSLAVQTSKATEEIAAQIAAIQDSTNRAVEAIRRNTERMQEINRCTAAVAASVSQQNSATSEISQNVVGAATGTRDVVAVLGRVAGAVTETQNSAHTVLAASTAVEAAAASLSEKVETFLTRVAV